MKEAGDWQSVLFSRGILFGGIRRLEQAIPRPWPRLLVLIAAAWGPLAILTALAGTLWGQNVKLPLLADYATYARFWIALPLLVSARAPIAHWLGSVVEQIGEDLLSTEDARSKLTDRWNGFVRDTNSSIADLICLLIAIIAPITNLIVNAGAVDQRWSFVYVDKGILIAPAGYWFLAVSNLLVVALALKWFWVYLEWAYFLIAVAGMRLEGTPIHPDRRGGLGVLSVAHSSFAFVVTAISAVILGILVNEIVYFSWTQHKVQVTLLVYAAAVIVLIILPLLIFTPALIFLRRQGLIDYTRLGNTYVQGFAKKWVHEKEDTEEPLLGSSDIQSLADLFNSFQIVTSIRATLISMRLLLIYIVATLFPLLPLALFFIPLNELRDILQMLIKFLLG